MKIVYLSPGPLHLFFCSGVSYFWDLRGRGYHFVLVVPEYYRGSEEFAKIASLPEVLRVLYMPAAGRLRIHQFYAREFARSVKKFPPSVLLTHSCFFVDNLYLMKACAKAKSSVFIYQSARYSIDWGNEWWLILQNRIRNALPARRPTAFDRFLVRARFYISDWAAYFLDNMLLPLLFSGTCFTPSINVRNGQIVSRKWLGNRGATYLCYYDPEIEAMHRSLGPFECKKIRHPAVHNVRSVMSHLYGDGALTPSEPTILVVPSWGNIDSLLLEASSEAEVVCKVIRCWIQALEALLLRYPGHMIVYKLHPSSSGDRIMAEITQALKRHLGDKFLVRESAAPAERFAVDADVIVGDVSSVLWWSGLMGKRNVISLNIFDYPYGDMMKFYPGLVTLVSDTREIASLNPSVLDEDDLAPELAEVVGAC